MEDKILDEKSVFITSFNGEKIDISKLSADQLWSLCYEQEIMFAELIKKAEPFSTERTILMRNGYETVHGIAHVRSKKEGHKKTSFGAHKAYIGLVEKVIQKVVSQKGKCLFFEAGVGTGMIINSVSRLKNVIATGCDVYVDKNFINPDLVVTESTIYDALSLMENNSIDVFYWNDVIEHIPEDEIEDYMKLLRLKMSIGGLIITITPNKLNGPHDITYRFEPRGTIAKGFHFHEYTFNEISTMFQKHDCRSKYGFLGCAGRGWYILGPAKIIDGIKILAEKIVVLFPYRIKTIALVIMGCNVSIMKRRDNE